jgi:hypothetical protein
MGVHDAALSKLSLAQGPEAQGRQDATLQIGDVPLIVEIESGGSSLLVVHEW